MIKHKRVSLILIIERPIVNKIICTGSLNNNSIKLIIDHSISDKSTVILDNISPFIFLKKRNWKM